MAQKSDLNKIREHFKKTSGDDSNYKDKYFVLKPGDKGQEAKAIIRVLPPWSKRAEGFFYYTGGLHYGFRAGGRNKPIPCPESVEGKNYKCPICIFASKMQSSGSDEYTPLLKGFGTQITVQRRYYVNIIDRDDPDKIRIFGTNKKFIDFVLSSSDDEDGGDITDPKTGRDIVVTKGSGKSGRYNYRVRVKASKAEYNFKDLYQLDRDVLEWMEYDQMVQMLKDNFPEELKELGMKFKKKEVEETEEDEEVEEKPKKKIKNKKKRVAKPVEEEDDDEDTEEDEDDEESEDTEEDEDEDSEDEEGDDEEEEDEDEE